MIGIAVQEACALALRSATQPRKIAIDHRPRISKLTQSLSNELQVTAQTPPTFLFHTTEDKTVPVENSVLFYLALRKAGVAAEMHIFERGPHGVGLALRDPALAMWPELLANWLRMRGLLSAK